MSFPPDISELARVTPSGCTPVASTSWRNLLRSAATFLLLSALAQARRSQGLHRGSSSSTQKVNRRSFLACRRARGEVILISSYHPGITLASP